MEVNGYKIEPFAQLAGAVLIDEDLSGADFTQAELTGAKWLRCKANWFFVF